MTVSFSALQAQFLAPRYLGWLVEGWVVTLWSALLVVVFSTLSGTVFAVARSSGRAPLVWATDAYLSLFRNTPLLVQLFFWYFGLPALLPEGVLQWLNGPHVLRWGATVLARWPSFEFLAAVVGLVFYSTAYVGEEIRAGLRGVPDNQVASGMALGFTRGQLLRHVVLPQALRIVTPPLLGQYMNIVKNTSLGMAIGLLELSYRSRQAEAETWKTFQVYGVTTLLYVVAIAVLEVAGQQLQRRQAPAR